MRGSPKGLQQRPVNSCAVRRKEERRGVLRELYLHGSMLRVASVGTESTETQRNLAVHKQH